MKDFMLIYRADYSSMIDRSPEEREAMTKRYMDWINNIAGEDKLVDMGNRLAPTGKVVSAGNVVTNGPYTEVKEFIGGYSMIKAESYEEAVELLKGSPVFELNGKIEVREISYIK
jgi:hypothetical protein